MTIFFLEIIRVENIQQILLKITLWTFAVAWAMWDFCLYEVTNQVFTAVIYNSLFYWKKTFWRPRDLWMGPSSNVSPKSKQILPILWEIFPVSFILFLFVIDSYGFYITTTNISNSILEITNRMPSILLEANPWPRTIIINFATSNIIQLSVPLRTTENRF